MRTKFMAVLCLLTITAFSLPCRAEEPNEEDIFLSLTRRPTPRTDLPTNISVITSEDIEKSGAHSLPDLLDRLPGIDLTRSGSLGSFTSIRIRGVTTADQIQVLLDDEPLGGVSIQNINIDLIPLEDIERIEVVRGGSSVLYGANTIGGVVRILTKRHVSERPSVSAGFEGGSFQTKIARASAGAKGNHLYGRVTGSGYDTDGFQRNADVKNRNGSGDIGYFFENGGSLDASVSVTNRDLGSPNGTPIPFDQWNGENERTPNSATQRIENNMDRARLKGFMPLGEAGSVQTTVYHSRETYKLRLQAGVDPLATFDNRITGQDTRFLFHQGSTVGLAYERDERESLGQLPRHITNWGAYFQQEATLKKWVLIPALRFDQHSSFGNQWNPRLSAVYKAMESLQFSANAARAFRSPTLVDLYIVATDPFFPAFDFFGNPNLKPEIAVTYDSGVWFKPMDIWELTLTGFYTRIRDRIDSVDTDGNGNVDTLRNFSKAEIRGAEFETSVQTGILKHTANITLQRAQGTSATSTRFVPLRLTPHYLFNYQLDTPLPGKLYWTNTVQGSGRQYELDNKGGVKLPPYTLWHSRLSRQIRWARIFGSVQNILDKRYAESVTFGNAVPQPGRTYWGGVELEFR